MGRKHPQLVWDNYEFNLEQKASDRSFWSCKYKLKTRCKARIMTSGRTVTFKAKNGGNVKRQVPLTSTNDAKLQLLLDVTLETRAIVQLILDSTKRIDSGINNKHEILRDDKIKGLFPLGNLAQLMEVDSLLQEDKEMEQQLINQLRLLGGMNAKKNIRRIMSRIFTNDLGTLCSWTGQKQNFRVSDLKLIEICKTAVTQGFPDTTAKLFEDTVADWLRFSKQRKIREKQL